MEILVTKENGILSIELNRPDKKNALTTTMYQTLADTLVAANTDPLIRVLVLSGKPEIFTAGNDLTDFLKNPPKGHEHPVVQFMSSLSRLSKPIIAVVCGSAIGIGTTLLLHCDMVYAADNAKFSMPFSQLGLCPEFASSLLLSRVTGYQWAAEKLMLGEAFSAEEAHRVGIVNKLFSPEQVLPYAMAQAAKLVALPASSIRATKSLMRNVDATRIAQQIDDEMKIFSVLLTSPEAKEAFTAFFEKRKADFSNFP